MIRRIWLLVSMLVWCATVSAQSAEEKIPINRSLIAFTIAEKDLLPENVAYDEVEAAFYVGSTRKGKIVKVDKQGRISDFIAPRRDGLWMVIGMKVDARRRVLWVNSSAGGNLVGYKDTGTSPAGVFKFDLKTGKLIKKYVLDQTGEKHFFNDLVLNARGDVFVTHMFNESAVYKIAAERDELELFVKTEGFTEPNGIALGANDRLLFVAHDEGVSVFNVATKERRLLTHPDDVNLKGIDGLYVYRKSLIAVHPGRRMIRRYHLDDRVRSVTRAETIEAHHPMFNNPTTGVVVGDQFYYVANAQFGSFNKDGSLFPIERLFEVVILKVSLEPSLTGSNPSPQLETVATGLEIPWSIDFAPDGRIFLTERPGRIRVIENGKLKSAAWATLDVAHIDGAGLMGLAISPDFATDKRVYALGTFKAQNDRLVNRIYRFTEQNGQGTKRELLIDNLPSARAHGGGEISFGPDGMLYVTMGDALDLEAVQDVRSPVGKVLRYRADGSIPPDNPFPNSAVYAIGLRNAQGMDWHPETQTLFATEHGPTDYPGEGGRIDQDELNVILAGENYGWPLVSGMHQGDKYIKPLVEWTPAIAPAGLAICKVKNSRWYGNLFVGSMRGEQLRRIKVEPSSSARAGWRVVEEEALFHNQFGRIRAVAMGNDGYLYFATSNHDGDGKALSLATAPDDRLLRLRLA